MNVLHIISSLDIGGAEVLVSEIANQNKKLPFKLFIISNRHGILQKTTEKEGVSLDVFGKKGIDVGYIYTLRNFVKQHNINIVHCHDRMNAVNSILACSFLNCALVFSVHGFSFNKSWLRPIIINGFKKVLFVSNVLKSTIVKNDPKYLTVYNGINSLKFFDKAEGYWGQKHKKEESLRAGMIGNFKNSARDQLTVCKALNILHKKGVNFTFLFVGEKSETHPQFFDVCYDFCRENDLLEKVHFAGLRQDIPEILSQLDIFVYASHTETFCLSVVEAMMSGTPVVVNDLPVFKEITQNGRYAVIFKSRNEHDLAIKMEQMMSDKEKCRQLGQAGQEWARSQFTIEKHIDQLHKVYQDLIHA